jgi:hypothetical protein
MAVRLSESAYKELKRLVRCGQDAVSSLESRILDTPPCEESTSRIRPLLPQVLYMCAASECNVSFVEYKDRGNAW